MNKLVGKIFALLFLTTSVVAQDFTYNGFVRSLSEVGVSGVKAQLFTMRSSAYEITKPTYSLENTGGTVIPSSDDVTHGPFNIGFAFTFFGLPFNNSLNFDGTNDYVEIPKNFQDDFTIEYWMRTTQTGGAGGQWYSGQGLVDGELGGVRNDFGTSLVGSKLAFGIGNPDVTIFSTSNVNTGNWVHVAVTWKRSTGEMKLYINGTLEATGTSGTGIRDQSTILRVGSQLAGVGYFNGTIDDLRIWSVVRTQSEIQGSRSTEILVQTNLIQYYKFNQGTASGTNTGVNTLTDISGNNRTGTLYNFALNGATSNWVYYDPTNTYTQFYVGSNGWIGFSAGQTTGYVAQFIPNAGSPKNAILAGWEDLLPGSANIYYQTIGTAPNRKLVVSFNNVPHYGCRSNLHSFQFVLYETTNVIDINVTNKPLCTGNNSTQGLVNAGNTRVVPVDGRNASLWSLTNETIRFTPDAPDLDWILASTQYTNSTGRYTFSGLGRDINNYTFKIEVSAPIGISTLFGTTDADVLGDIILGKTSIQSQHYYTWDVNSDGNISASDLYICWARRNNLVNSWNVPILRLFNQTEGTTIKSGTTNMVGTLTGSQLISISSPPNNGTSTIYILPSGFSNPASLTYTY